MYLFYHGNNNMKLYKINLLARKLDLYCCYKINVICYSLFDKREQKLFM